jgi:hypothetical protein
VRNLLGGRRAGWRAPTATTSTWRCRQHRGLSAAYDCRNGLSFVVLERGSRAGGVILGEKVDEYVIDGG